MQKFDPVVLKAVIVNEAHHAAVSSYHRILSHFNSGIKNLYPIKGVEDKAVNPAVPTTDHSVPIIGFSTTFSRHDELALGSGFNRIVYFLDMVEEQCSCTCSDQTFTHTDVGFGTGHAMCDPSAFRRV